MKTDYLQLDAGFEFEAKSYTLDAESVNAYLQAVEETGDLYKGTGLVPPTAVAAYAVTALADNIPIPPGTVHISQELEFLGAAHTGDTITYYPVVSRKQDRGTLHLMTIEVNMFNQDRKKVMTGRLGLILPNSSGSGAK